MDSMLGYKNERYLYFGRCAAKLDDAANWLPSRLAALLVGLRRRRLTGSSATGRMAYLAAGPTATTPAPTAPRPRAPAPGRLGVQLAGPAYYFGEYYDKPTIGDSLRPVEPQDILRAEPNDVRRERCWRWRLGLAVRALALCLDCEATEHGIGTWRRLGGLPGGIWPRCAGFFGQRQPAGSACGRGGGHHGSAADGRPLPGPACAATCATALAEAEGVPAELDFVRQRGSGFDFPPGAGPASRAARCCPRPPLPSMPPRWIPWAARCSVCLLAGRKRLCRDG